MAPRIKKASQHSILRTGRGKRKKRPRIRLRLSKAKRMIRKITIFFISVLIFGCDGSKQDNAEPEEPERNEKHRPLFHFTPPQMWMNDPNGMVFHNGEYHLFYQHYPDSTIWGPMHWGHAVSKDLIHWEHLPIALYPDSLGYIFSGSAVFDRNNTSGLGTTDKPPLVAIFTYHSPEKMDAGRKDFQTQGLAYSLDHGRTWEKYAGNPVLKSPGIADFRDPKVFWHADTKKWIMVLAVRDRVELFRSEDLKVWNKSDDFGETERAHGGVWECPDLFPLMVEGENTQKWVMLVSINPGGLYGGSATQYFIGTFDGKTFRNDNPPAKTLWVDYGKDNYAGVTWSDIPETDGRRIFLGWMSNWQYANVVPTETWRSAMTIPRTLHLQNTPDGIRLASLPVKELEQIRQTSFDITPQHIDGRKPITNVPFNITPSEMLFEFELRGENTNAGIELSNAKGQKLSIGFDGTRKSFYVDRRNAGSHGFSDHFAGIHYAPAISANDKISLHIFLDVASVEVFADDGKAVITDIFFPDKVFNTLTVFTEGGAAELRASKVFSLQLEK